MPRRLLRMAAVLLVVTFAVFSLLALVPGDPARVLLGPDASNEAYEQVRASLGLDRPFLVRYLEWLGDVFRGDLGRSYINGREVTHELWDALPATIELVFLAQAVGLVFGVGGAFLSVWKQGRWPDRIISAASSVLISVPSFVVAVVAIYLFAISLGWLPATGFRPIGDGLFENLKLMILPAGVLGFHLAAIYARVLRTDLAETLSEGYIELARAKGEPTWRILLVHALRPSSLNLVTAIGINVGNLIGASIIIETMFGLNGVGQLLVHSINTRDYLLTQGVVLLGATTYVVVNTVVDMAYGGIDPRMREFHDARG